MGGRWSSKVVMCMLTTFLVFGKPTDVKAVELPETFKQHVYACSEAMDIDPYIVLALIETESGNCYTAVNKAGNCFGLCQIHKCWDKKAKEYGINIYDPYGNIAWCTIMLSDCYKEYNDWNKALVKYNAGRLYAESSPYSRKIIARANELRKEAENVSRTICMPEAAGYGSSGET